jgi:uncharacterized protein YdeI (YjbR/CyaY-like superfamily)
MNPEVDHLLLNAGKWQAEMRQLRSILLDCALEEEYKWKQACYCYKGNNIVILHSFNDYCGLGFFKGSLLSDTNKLLEKSGENTQGSRVLKFRSLAEIIDAELTVKAYLFEAIEVEKAGLQVDYSSNKELVFPDELINIFAANTTFKAAFEGLTIGRQRAYNLFFSAPKQSKTIVTRIEKYIPRIMSGYGINDCTCGQSKRMPNCDGSHKYILKHYAI